MTLSVGMQSFADLSIDIFGFLFSGALLKSVGTVSAAGLAAIAAAKVVGLGEDQIRAVVIEFAGFRG
jgi:hypothetical protein